MIAKVRSLDEEEIFKYRPQLQRLNPYLFSDKSYRPHKGKGFSVMGRIAFEALMSKVERTDMPPEKLRKHLNSQPVRSALAHQVCIEYQGTNEYKARLRII